MESYDLHSESDSEYIGKRKGRKLMAEKRRRARINQCLTEIKNIVCAEQQQDPNYEKIEKAEILETTVDYLRNVRKINTTPQQVKETVQARFQQGFSRCAEEILTYIQSLPGVSDNVQHQLRKHLSGRLNPVQQMPVTSSTQHVTSHMNYWHERLASNPAQYPHPAAHAYMNMSVRTSPVKNENILNDSGYCGTPNFERCPVTEDKSHQNNLSSNQNSFTDSQLCHRELNEGRQYYADSRINAWRQSATSYSHDVKMGKQPVWRPW